MSQYYRIEGMKVRVSDHEPNYSMDKIRGMNDVEFYTIDACGSKLSVVAQVENYCDKNDIDISLFAKVIADYPDDETTGVYEPEVKLEEDDEDCGATTNNAIWAMNLKKISPRMQDVLNLVHTHSVEDIAQTLEISIATVKINIEKLKAKRLI